MQFYHKTPLCHFFKSLFLTKTKNDKEQIAAVRMELKCSKKEIDARIQELKPTNLKKGISG